MIKINKSTSANTFTVEQNGIIKTYPAIYYSENIYEDVVSILERDTEDILFNDKVNVFQIDGITYTSAKDAVIALNNFIGNFKKAAEPQNTGDTINSVTSIKNGKDVSLTIVTDKNETGFQTNIEIPKSGFLIRWNVTGINVTVNNGNTYNIIQHLVGLNPVLTIGTNSSEFPIINTGVNALIKFPANSNLTSYMFDVRLTGSMTSSSDRTFTLQLRRSDNSLVKGDTFTKSGGTTLVSESNNIFTYTNGINDPYTIGGVKMEINNTSSSNITLTGFEIIIDGTIKNY